MTAAAPHARCVVALRVSAVAVAAATRHVALSTARRRNRHRRRCWFRSRLRCWFRRRLRSRFGCRLRSRFRRRLGSRLRRGFRSRLRSRFLRGVTLRWRSLAGRAGLLRRSFAGRSLFRRGFLCSRLRSFLGRLLCRDLLCRDLLCRYLLRSRLLRRSFLRRLGGGLLGGFLLCALLCSHWVSPIQKSRMGSRTLDERTSAASQLGV